MIELIMLKAAVATVEVPAAAAAPSSKNTASMFCKKGQHQSQETIFPDTILLLTPSTPILAQQSPKVSLRVVMAAAGDKVDTNGSDQALCPSVVRQASRQ